MINLETITAIEEKQKQIAQLKAEIAQLRSPKLATITESKPKGNWFSETAQADEWKDFVVLARRLHANLGESMPKLNTLSSEQLHMSAAMLDEMIPIYNKYWTAIHERNTKNERTEI